MHLPRTEDAKLSEQTNTLLFEGEVLLGGALQTCERLRSCLSAPEGLDVDATGIACIDISIVQLLIAAFKSADAAGKRFSVSYAADGPLDTLLQRAGFVLPDGKPLMPEHTLWTRISG